MNPGFGALKGSHKSWVVFLFGCPSISQQETEGWGRGLWRSAWTDQVGAAPDHRAPGRAHRHQRPLGEFRFRLQPGLQHGKLTGCFCPTQWLICWFPLFGALLLSSLAPFRTSVTFWEDPLSCKQTIWIVCGPSTREVSLVRLSVRKAKCLAP